MGGGSKAPDPSLDDPAMQQVLLELQLAYSLGSTNELPYFGRVFPQLAVSTNGIVTVTPTQIFATSIVLPTIAPTVLPSPSPTAIATPMETSSSAKSSENLVVAIIGLIVIAVMYTYIRKAKWRGND